MSGEKNLQKLLHTMQPKHNGGKYVFCTIENLHLIDVTKTISIFKEAESYSIIIQKELADALYFSYTTITGWITLTVYSSLQAVGLIADISTA